jgi:hypothetical protein
MARIRSIKPEFFRHLELYQAEVESGLPLRVAFPGLWVVADREGRFRWQPEVLKLDILPFDNIDFSRVLDALLTRGFLVKYEVSGKQYGFIPTFKHHQFINNRELPSVLPQPLEHCEYIEDSRVPDACLTRDSRVPDASIRVIGKGNLYRERECNVVLSDAEARAREYSENPEIEPEKSKTAAPQCPCSKLVDLYHSHCTTLPRVESWNGSGKASMVARWKEDRARQSLEWWERYFVRISESDFLTGRIKEFSANLNWLVGPKNMEKILNGAYDNRSTQIPERLRNNIRAGIEFLQGD